MNTLEDRQRCSKAGDTFLGLALLMAGIGIMLVIVGALLR
jgi:hypothetical protein